MRGDELRIKPAIVSFMQLVLGFMVGLGSLIAYSESKFTTREAHAALEKRVELEASQRQTDIQRIEMAINAQSGKIDAMYNLMIDRRGR